MVSKSKNDQQQAFAKFLPQQTYLQGTIFAVAACPEIPMPEQWMPWVICSNSDAFIDRQQADELADFLMAQLRDTLDKMRRGESCLPEDCRWHSDTSQRENLQQWLKGLLTGHQQLEEQWLQAWNESSQSLDLESLSARLTRCLKLFSTLADPQSRLQQTPMDRRAELERGLPRLADSLPGMLKEYVDISGELMQVLPNQFEVVPKNH
ncbi:UPF0149 family protein [Alteromonas lipolytica]|uniref:YecA family protein n=1 Tax=Alteromonas lipolytica TaxID=1856405 RepID=A0A1E8FA13_9ALTE|nr:UPF0149 family protein [Alteromonas lipolytica]OFI32749.1 hypothetical protein BFC17_06250 [Alteromonas lipolytica]GGF73416.1 hypothetical protein GCM10011338_26950 [Alteromonas lipolytica]